jgi:hypothetical protein
MKKPFVVKTGKNPALIDCVFNLAERAGYKKPFGAWEDYASEFMFGQDYFEFSALDDDPWYAEYGQIFDARTEMGKLIEFLEQKEDKIYIIEGSQKKEVVITKEGVTAGCVKINAETAMKIANKIIEVVHPLA